VWAWRCSGGVPQADHRLCQLLSGTGELVGCPVGGVRGWFVDRDRGAAQFSGDLHKLVHGLQERNDDVDRLDPHVGRQATGQIAGSVVEPAGQPGRVGVAHVITSRVRVGGR
jgi:hypothetical protein